jgi:leucyl aminopeptidase (aminopeptidase T)
MSIEVAVRAVLVDCLGVEPGENVLIVVDPDPERLRIGAALAKGARELGAETVLAEMSERESHGAEPPPMIAAAMLACDVFIAPTTKSLSHTTARKEANEKGVRGATMPQITEQMLVRTMTADYSEVNRRSKALAELLTAGSVVHITSDKGTDVTLGIEGRQGLQDDGDLKGPGSFGNLPAGEGFIAPVEGTTEGRVVFDGSVVPFASILEHPITVEVRGGYAEEFSGPQGAEWRSRMEPFGKEAFNVAELGIGTNEKAKLTGNILEDEKIIGTIHIAFGDNHTFGGTVEVASHLDALVLSPTVDIDGRKVLEGGHLLV